MKQRILEMKYLVLDLSYLDYPEVIAVFKYKLEAKAFVRQKMSEHNVTYSIYVHICEDIGEDIDSNN